METHKMVRNSTSQEEDTDLRRGPWTVDEDLVLMSYITNNGEGHWNSLARGAGLKRTGKSFRLRWLNYLRPDVRRGNITPEEQLLILELHSRWGNQWSKIAQYLPGRTDNEIKNYWRTRVQKHGKQLQCDVNSKQFKDVMRYLWMPRLVERIRAASASSSGTADSIIVDTDTNINQMKQVSPLASELSSSMAVSMPSDSLGSSSSPLPVANGQVDCHSMSGGEDIADEENRPGLLAWWCTEPLPSPGGHGYLGSLDFDQSMWGDSMSDNLWSANDIWSLQHML